MSRVRKAAERKRRLIYQEDGAAEKPSHSPEATAACFLATVIDDAVDSQVDTWTYNVGNCWLNKDGPVCCPVV